MFKFEVPCKRCGYKLQFDSAPKREVECALCAKLGDRSLNWFIREMAAARGNCAKVVELKARFAAAKGRSAVTVVRV